MPLVLQLQHCHDDKYFKSGVDTFNTFWVMGYIKVLQDDDNDDDNNDDLAITTAQLFLQIKQAKNVFTEQYTGQK